MALHRAITVLQGSITTPVVAGAIHRATFTHTFTGAVTAGDIIEMGALPANCQIVGAVVNGAIAAASTIDVGFVSGVYGDKDEAGSRTVGAELFDGVAKATDVTLSPVAANAIAVSDETRGVGITLSGNAAADDTLTLVVDYIA